MNSSSNSNSNTSIATKSHHGPWSNGPNVKRNVWLDFSVLIMCIKASLDWRHLHKYSVYFIHGWSLCFVHSFIRSIHFIIVFSHSLRVFLSTYFHVSYWKMWFDLIIMTNLKLNNFWRKENPDSRWNEKKETFKSNIYMCLYVCAHI